MSLWLWVALGGALGACGRFGVAQLLGAQMADAGVFPWATFTVNALGACAIGAAIGGFGHTTWFNDFGRAFLVTGVLGGFTTFSAFSLEFVQLGQAGQVATAASYVLLSLLVCGLGVWAGLSMSLSIAGSTA